MNRMEQGRTFITGIEGFAGGHLKKEMEDSGFFVSGTTLSEADKRGYENIFQCDIREGARVSELVQNIKPQYLVHLAAFVSPSGSIKEPELTRDININGTRNLFEAVRLAMKHDTNYRPRIVIVGSTEEFGDVPNGSIITEETIKHPNNPYGQSKLDNFLMAKEYINKHGLDIVSAIPSNHTGPGQEKFFAAEVAKQIVQIENNLVEPVLITGDISNKKNYSDVRDIARAYRLLLEAGKTGERYLICNDKNVSLSYIVETLMGFSTVEITHQIDNTKGRQNEVKEVFYSNKKLKEATGYEPKIKIDKTLEDLLNYHRKKGKIN
jgi:GDP-4-dehydro-6-deoxy-D-mannose reductase